jgi:hypothetical protein
MTKYSYFLTFFTILLLACNKKISKEEQIKQQILALEDSISKTIYPDSLLEVSVVPGQKFGLLHNEISFADLQKKYGEKNVKTYRDTISGHAYATSVLFEGQPNELQIVWHNEELLQYPQLCYFSHPKAKWQADKNIKIGTTLDEIVQLNGGVVEVVGFGSSLDGGLLRYKDGKLKDFGKYYNIFLGYDKAQNPNVDATLLGTNSFLSDAASVKTVPLKVVKIQAYLNKK